MTFTLRRNAQFKPMPGMPLDLEVTGPHPRRDYPMHCGCSELYLLTCASVALCIEKRLILKVQDEDETYVCRCLGAVDERMISKVEEKIREMAREISTGRRAPEENIENDLRSLLALHREEIIPSPRPGTLKLERPLACFDLEGTGLDTETSRIVEAAFVVIYPDGRRTKFCQRFNPGIPIPAEATAVHGITDADVADKPSFASWAPKIHKALQGKDLATYNGRSYDLALLDAEFRRAGLRLETDGVRIVDAYLIFAAKEKRDLSAAVRKYCGREHEGAHGALADADATADIILGMCGAYPDLESVPALEESSLRDADKRPADLAGKLYFDKDGDLCYGFGKSRDLKVRTDTGFGLWMRRQSNPAFPASTMGALNAELRRLGEI